MKKFVHILILLALYNICGFCLIHSNLTIATVVGMLFLLNSWSGMFISLTRLMIMIIENGKSAVFPNA
ncbi:hypothetical protein D6855_15825 [Butyrivibrio sp. CB08]|nr:hypothetical protein D6855_15825 [Butyrivibrio sp. CB08]